MKIEVVGPGCPRCISTERNVKVALKELGKDAAVEHIFDVKEFAKRGVMFTPAVIIDGEIVTSGRIPTVDEIKKILSDIK